MKILFLNTDLGYGGAEKNMVFVANSMAEKGHDVFLLTYRNKIEYQVLNEKVTHDHIQYEYSGGSVLNIITTSLMIHRYIKDKCFDVAIAFLSPSQIRLVIACMFTKTRVVLSQRGDPYHNGKTLFAKINKFFFQRADGFVFQTENAKRYYDSKAKKRGVIIFNPCQRLIRTKSICDDKRVIVTAARLDIKQKRQDLLIEAFNRFSKEHGEYKLHIFGDGDDKPIVEKLAKSNSSIVLMGKADNIVEAIQQATFFVLTSDFEGVPNALMEAMSLGLPCISTKCSPGGAELLIEDGISGLLVDCGNANQLYQAMDKLANNDELRNSLSEKAVYVNKEFKPEVIADRWEKYLLMIANRYEKKQ